MLSVASVPTLAGSFIGLIVIHIIVTRIRAPLARIPGPEISKWTNIVYLYYWFSGNLPYYVHKLHQQYGPIVRVSSSYVDVCDVESVREIYKTNARFLKSKFYDYVIAPDVQCVLNIKESKAHASRRRLLGSPMSDTSISTHEPLIQSHVQLTIQRMAEEMQSRGFTDVFQWWTFMATDIIGELSFGESFRMLQTGKTNQYIKDLQSLSTFEALKTTFPWVMQLASYIRIPVLSGPREVFMRVQDYAIQSILRYENIFNDPEKAKTVKTTLLTKLFDFEKSGLSRNQIVEEAQLYIVAGSDTTANTLAYLVYCVCSDSQSAVREKLVAELNTLPDGFADKDLRDLPYLNYVILETLRLFTPVQAGLPRAVPPEGATLSGAFIPGGMTVASQAYSLHRDPTTFPEPDSFRPERWENTTKDMKDSNLAFGGGSRVCLGIHLARMELRLATASFFRAFPNARVSKKEGMSEEDMVQKVFYLSAPTGHRCLVEL